MDNQLGFEILTKVHRLLNSQGVKFFIHAGTLLGLWRDKKFIGHDHDLDFGVMDWNEDTVKKIKEILTQNGFYLKWEYYYDGKLTEQTFIYNGVPVIPIDFFYFYEDEKSHYHYTHYCKEYRSDNKMNTIKNVYDKINHTNIHTIEGNIVRLPDNPVSVLKSIYGEKWEIPTKDYVYYEPFNAIKCDLMGEVKIFGGR
jgi:hypothetical protein